MKVLHVSTHLNIGGIGNYITSLACALKKKGVVVMVASSGGNLEPELKRCGVCHKTLRMKTKFELSPKVFASAVDISKIVKDEKIDISHAHSRVSQAAAFFASRLTGVPCVTTCHGYFKVRFRKIFDTWGRKVIAISDAVENHLKDDLGVDEGRVELIYNGIDIDRFSRQYSDAEKLSLKRSLGLKGPVVGTIGRLSPVKGQRYLIEAMAEVVRKVPDVKAVIMGDGEEDKKLKSLAKELNIEDTIRFVPSDPDTVKFLSIMDVFVLPSVKEGLGLALLEALGSGRACVASRVGGIRDIIESGMNGILVGVGDPKAIAAAVISLLNDAQSRQKMGQAGREMVRERFSLDSMSDKVIKLYESVVFK